MRFKSAFAALGLAILVGGCLQSGAGTKQTVGGLGGAALGGLLGSQFGDGTGQLAFTALGALGGALIGSELGRALDDNDRRQANSAARQAQSAPIGQTIAWSNPDSGNSGSVTPLRDGTGANGSYCREFQQTVNIGGRTESAYGVACRQPDGSWEIVQ